MDVTSGEWVAVLSCENQPGAPRPPDALAAWLRDRGIDWNPLASRDVRVDLVCGRAPDGRWRGQYRISVPAGTLRRLGLHPDQPTA